MFKYMKYEIRGTYRYILGVLILAFILITGIYTYATRGNTVGGNIFIVLSAMLLFGIALVTFLYIVGSFRKELYEDTGYLTFTLPLSGYQIVASKLIVALLWFFVLGIAIAVYNLIMVFSFTPVDINILEWLTAVTQLLTVKQAAVMITGTLISGVNLLVLIYLSMALSRVTFRNKKIGGLWFVIFLLLSTILAYGQYQIAELFPYYVNFETFTAGGNITMPHYGAGANINVALTNIASLIYQIVTIAALFWGTGYLIEKKIDL